MSSLGGPTFKKKFDCPPNHFNVINLASFLNFHYKSCGDLKIFDIKHTWIELNCGGGGLEWPFDGKQPIRMFYPSCKIPSVQVFPDPRELQFPVQSLSQVFPGSFYPWAGHCWRIWPRLKIKIKFSLISYGNLKDFFWGLFRTS